MYSILHHKRGNLEHWDFLFEVPGQDLLRTFQVFLAPEGEVVCRGIACRETEPHRRKYLVYEGEIEGNRGTVTRWDTGVLRVLRESPKLLRIQLESSMGRKHPEWVLHFIGGGDWRLRSAGQWPVIVNPIHLPVAPEHDDPLDRCVFKGKV